MFQNHIDKRIDTEAEIVDRITIILISFGLDEESSFKCAKNILQDNEIKGPRFGKKVIISKSMKLIQIKENYLNPNFDRVSEISMKLFENYILDTIEPLNDKIDKLILLHKVLPSINFIYSNMLKDAVKYSIERNEEKTDLIKYLDNDYFFGRHMTKDLIKYYQDNGINPFSFKSQYYFTNEKNQEFKELRNKYYTFKGQLYGYKDELLKSNDNSNLINILEKYIELIETDNKVPCIEYLNNVEKIKKDILSLNAKRLEEIIINFEKVNQEFLKFKKDNEVLLLNFESENKRHNLTLSSQMESLIIRDMVDKSGIPARYTDKVLKDNKRLCGLSKYLIELIKSDKNFNGPLICASYLKLKERYSKRGKLSKLTHKQEELVLKECEKFIYQNITKNNDLNESNKLIKEYSMKYTKDFLAYVNSEAKDLKNKVIEKIDTELVIKQGGNNYARI